MKSLFEFRMPDFDDHIQRSIPAVDDLYALAHSLTFSMAQEGTIVVDLGCSTGKFLLETQKREGVRYIGVDKMEWERESDPCVHFFTRDAMTFLSDVKSGASVILSLFTLQFTPYHQRENVIKLAAERLVEGGIFIIAEKTSMPSRGLDDVFERDLIEWKRGNFEDKEILNKSFQLSGAMRRMPQPNLINMMSNRFSSVNIIWANGAFIGLVGVK